MNDILNLCPLENSFKEFSEIVKKRRMILYGSSDSWLQSEIGNRFDSQTICLDHRLDNLENLIACLEDWNDNIL